MPQWAGQWGFAHYNSTCQLIVEAPDPDLDFWFGMMIMQVKRTIKPGDYAFLRYDQSDGAAINWAWNSNTAQGLLGTSDDNPSSCYCKSDGYGCPHLGSCPSVYTDPDLIIGGGYELADPNLPPGETMSHDVRAGGCLYGDGTYTCGGHAFTGGVVCAQ
jgi:hypothetical protein